MQWYRDELGRRMGLAPVEVVCLELARRHGAASSSQVRERTGLTRSAVAKLLRRLENAGHLERVEGEVNGEVEVVLRPHAERDALLASLRQELTRALTPVAGAGGAALLTALSLTTQAQHVRARALADAADERRRLDARRRAREADPITPWWTR